MLKSIIIEDQPPAQRILQKYISDLDSIRLEKTFCDIHEARNYLQENPVDLLFLDINLPRVSGIDFLKSEANHPLTILTTAHSEFALECYQYNVVDYLLKPFSYERFAQAIQKVMLITRNTPRGIVDQETASKSVYVKCSHDLVKIKTDDILFIKSDSDYTEIFTTSGKLLTTAALKDWTAKLNDDFRQVHKSYIVNISHLKKISRNKIFLQKDHVIPVGRAFKKDFMQNMIQRAE